MPGEIARASTRPDCQIAVAADHALPPPKSTATIGRPRWSATSRLAICSKSSTVNNIVASSADGKFKRYERNRALSLESAMAAFSSPRSCLRNSGEIFVSGLTRATSRQLFHFVRSPCRHFMARPWPDLPVARSGHHPPMAGASVPMYKLRSGDPGLPFAVSMASKSSWPPTVSHEPGSSHIAQGGVHKAHCRSPVCFRLLGASCWSASARSLPGWQNQ